MKRTRLLRSKVENNGIQTSRRLNCCMGWRHARGSRNIIKGTNASDGGRENYRGGKRRRVSQGQLQLKVWEDLIKSGKCLSSLARRKRNGKKERICSRKNQCGKIPSGRSNYIRIESETSQGNGNWALRWQEKENKWKKIWDKKKSGKR